LNNTFVICVVCALLHPHLVQERGVDAADLISFMLELSFHVIGEVRHYCSLMRVFLHKKNLYYGIPHYLNKVLDSSNFCFFVPFSLVMFTETSILLPLHIIRMQCDFLTLDIFIASGI